MALVNVANMVVLDNPAPFANPLQFEITFECLQPLEDDLEWKVVYVSSAENSTLDQTLDEILVGPIPVGINKFILQADAPDPSTIPDSDVLGVTVLLVTCSYREREFVRVGYYVNNEYGEVFDEEVGPPTPLDMGKVVRTILADKPRVTRFPINWGDLSKEEDQPPPQTEEQIQDTANMMMGEDAPMVTEEDEEEEEEEEDEEDDDMVEGGKSFDVEELAQDAPESMVTNE